MGPDSGGEISINRTEMERRREERERGGEEERGERKGRSDENHVPHKHKKRRRIGEKCLLHIENAKKKFSIVKKANCETPFPVFCNILSTSRHFRSN